MNTDQFMDSMYGKALYAFLGFGIPLVFLAAQVLLGWGNLPIMILMISWLGFAILFYMGVTDEETTG
ncbi:MAG: hypothetical protein KKH41_03005 [Candidatus Thermoplasmatota archaeon]|nr:hypothetical protein [Euryarchaeota archaeon]MBU4032043.1 hypothetical protein [Candidatus Thermoplasmatota archaeon]MBU4070737.1 hypothetical protein [Candidatus Thermoplasmatota archaeon]MBU4145167.1 hypothetical protein [Candidatus Thermoplasmatota archaeon]MBU4591533.1 hypothetical protein [Candidatus Thermoplasmatota archaeon]